MALVGPTGVGKTTTTAKLAAHFRLQEHRRVGLITVDTYRIAAVEQLRTYADIIELPMEVASTPRRDAASHQPTGRSRPDPDGHGRSQPTRRSANSRIEVAAGRSPTGRGSSGPELRARVPRRSRRRTERFAPVGANRLILTKLDEAQCLGTLLPLLRTSRLPLSYLTVGQNVPDDIEVADPVRLAQQILGSREVSSAVKITFPSIGI